MYKHKKERGLNPLPLNIFEKTFTRVTTLRLSIKLLEITIFQKRQKL